MDSIDHMLNQWVMDKQIPGGVLCITQCGEQRYFKAFGAYPYEHDTLPFTLSTLFDLASLTKVMITLPAALSLVDSKDIQLDDSVQKYIPQFKYANVSIRHLLQHSSGLPADLPFKTRFEQRDVLADILNQELLHVPGEKVLYSDLGMILMGHIISVVTDQSLDEYAQQTILEPLGMKNTLFNPPDSLRKHIAPTELINDQYIVGVVHDEKAFQLGGISGSAGLFSNAHDLHKYAAFWLDVENQDIISAELMKQSLCHSAGNRGLGWEVWSGEGSVPSCGSQWVPGSFGHTGFTGTSLWMDPANQLSVILLTNAVHYGRANPIRLLRIQLLDQINNMKGAL